MRSSILSVFLQTATLTLSLAGAAAGAPGDIFVEFMARPTAPITAGTPGHAFFCLSYHLNTGVKEDCFGFYPKDLTKAFDGPGVISNEFNKKAILNVSVSLSHKVDKTTISKITAEINKWAGADYKLLVNNCGDFVFAIAKAAGLRTPNRQTVALPTEFVDGLKKLY